LRELVNADQNSSSQPDGSDEPDLAGARALSPGVAAGLIEDNAL
jgi:hypothetical protein